MEIPIELCDSCKAYKKDPVKRYLLLSVLIALYAVSVPYCVYTAGEPRKAAILNAQQLQDEKWALESAVSIHQLESNSTDLNSGDSESSLPNMDEISTQSNPFGSSVETSSSGFTFDEDESELGDVKSPSTASGGFLASFFMPSKEQKRAKAEFEKWQKDFKQKAGEDVSLPPEYLPSAWACLSFFLTLTLHALFFLLCHWMVWFKAWTLFKPVEKVIEGCWVLITPPPNRGSAACVEVRKSKTSGQLVVEFQRQKYTYIHAAKLPAEKKYHNGVFTLTAYPVNLPLQLYSAASGLKGDSDVEKAVDKFGRNHLNVAIPTFLELLQLQLLSPLAIFQVFCALLWLLDEYWSYTLFTLASVLVFEATTVFQRSRTQQMLGGMAPKPSPIYAFRGNKWIVITTKDLLPGDFISLAFKKRSNVTKGVPIQPASTANTVPAVADATSSSSKPAGPSPTSNSSPLPFSTTLDEIVPCDCLLLRGAAVVNEASLTGESVPQMKESLAPHTSQEDEGKLDMQGVHRVHVLFSGSSIITVSADRDGHKTSHSLDAIGVDSVPRPPDSGAIAYVLRTGFGSSQGALLQMIEFSQQSASGDVKETGLALLLLFVFALLASGYVLKEGLRKREKTTHELLLKCVIIITSVVPRQFPMQMAMAVNMALMALSKAGIFCTEPFRVPLAGKVTHCLFDKTGTLTTDQLVPVGIVDCSMHTATHSNADSNTPPPLAPVMTASTYTAMILAACHSLVVIEEDEEHETDEGDGAGGRGFNLVGDPIEVAAIRAIDWSWDGRRSTAGPDGACRRQAMALNLAQLQLHRLLQAPPNERLASYDRDVSALRNEVQLLADKLHNSKQKAAQALFTQLEVVQRHHFSSALQRMSVVVRAHSRNRETDFGVKSDSEEDEWLCLVKGSPEVLQQLCGPSQLPAWFSRCYEGLARRGLRVLALAYKRVRAEDVPASQPRQWVESGLSFGGFIAFECKIRSDSGIVVRSLLQADHKVMMLTGDSLLTSLHVAQEVGIVSSAKPSLILTVDKNAPESPPYWQVNQEPTHLPLEVDTIPTLSQHYNLLTTEDSLIAASKFIDRTASTQSAVHSSHPIHSKTGVSPLPRLWGVTPFMQVLARMSPHGKTCVIRAIQERDRDSHVVMCGDGGNDVGALKQADVGLALLAGHANSNTGDDVSKRPTPLLENKSPSIDPNAANNADTSTMSAEDALNLQEKKLKFRSEELNKLRAAHMKEFQARFTREQQAILQEEMRKLTEKGEYMAIFNLMKDQTGKIKQAMQMENMRFMALHGQVWDAKKDGDGLEGGLSSMEKLLEASGGVGPGEGGAMGGLPVVRPGDASVAAPFTSRIPSVRAVVDLIRQGRCTLLSALMQQQIMMLESTIAAYTLSALSLHNARSSERQMMASSWLIMTAAVSFSYASPLDHMHPLRPLRSLFHPAIFLSTFGQSAIHIACMTLAVHWATEAMGPAQLKEVTEFFKKVKAHEIDRSSLCGEEDFMCQFQAYWTAPFMPNLLNSVVFLVETSQMISVFFANYKGRPWMKGMLENHPLFLSVFLCVAGVIVAAWEMIPQLNDMLQLAPFPNDAFRYKVLILVISTIAGTFLWDRLCVFLFAPAVFKASMEEQQKVTIKDFYPIFTTVGKIAAVLLLLGSGNILLIGMAIYWYWNFTKAQQQKERQEVANL